MNFSKHYYGAENVSTLRKTLHNAALIPVLASLYGIWSDFVPSHSMSSIALPASLLAGTVVTLWVYRYWSKNGIHLENKQAGIISRAALVIGSPLFIYLIIWLAVAQGVPALITRLAGVPCSIESEMEKQKVASHRTCNYRLKGDVLHGAFPEYFCINRAYYHRLPAAARVTLSGYRTGLGFYIAQVYYKED